MVRTSLPIVIGVDYSANCRAAILEAGRLAMERPGTALHAVWVDNRFDTMSVGSVLSNQNPDDKTKALKRLHDFVVEVFQSLGSSESMPALSCHVRRGNPHTGMIAIASEFKAKLIVIGQPVWFPRIKKPNAFKLVLEAPCSVLCAVDKSLKQKADRRLIPQMWSRLREFGGYRSLTPDATPHGNRDDPEATRS